ncbi:MAG: hypothetical protein DRQ45_07640 [Gammaproteobacteria bacterium]|nr:MAG: hypothetical protein DRQ45_07640 [Gammaproteobacteria bacterium]
MQMVLHAVTENLDYDAVMALPRLSVHFDTAAEPLRKRAPSHDENGKPLSDFMMLVPGLRDKPKHIVDNTIQDIHIVLTHFSEVVVFAEFNLKLNLLWVSIRPVQRVRYEIATAIQEQVPEAKLVSHI